MFDACLIETYAITETLPREKWVNHAKYAMDCDNIRSIPREYARIHFPSTPAVDECTYPSLTIRSINFGITVDASGEGFTIDSAVTPSGKYPAERDNLDAIPSAVDSG